MMAAALRAGDVLQVKCGPHIGYVSYVSRHPSFGDAIWVVPRIFDAPIDDWKAVFSGYGYFAFYPAHAAARRGLVQKVGYSPDALRLLPTRWRNAINEDESGATISWLVTDGVERVPRQDSELGTEERMLPIGDIWNHPYLCNRIAEGWTPA